MVKRPSVSLALGTPLILSSLYFIHRLSSPAVLYSIVSLLAGYPLSHRLASRPLYFITSSRFSPAILYLIVSLLARYTLSHRLASCPLHFIPSSRFSPAILYPIVSLLDRFTLSHRLASCPLHFITSSRFSIFSLAIFTPLWREWMNFNFLIVQVHFVCR